VLGDDLSVIASGPTAPDPTTYHDAVAILKPHRIWQAITQTARRHRHRGCRGLVSETPKPGSSLFRRVHYHIVGSNGMAVSAVTHAARNARFCTTQHHT